MDFSSCGVALEAIYVVGWRAPRASARGVVAVTMALAAAGCGQEGAPKVSRSDAQARQLASVTTLAAVGRVDRDAAIPKRLEIPTIDVSAPVIPLGLEPDRTLEVPKDFSETGWRKAGPEPGEQGAALIAGHVDSKAGPAVFHRLDDLDRGDEIFIRRADGSTVRFIAESKEEVPKEEFPTSRVYAKTRRANLRLVTCSGDFDGSTGHYRNNTIMYARRH